MSSYLKTNAPRELPDFGMYRAKQYPADSFKQPPKKAPAVPTEMPIAPKEAPAEEPTVAAAPTWKKLPIKVPKKVPIKTPESIATAQAAAAAAEESQEVLGYEPEPAYEPFEQKHEAPPQPPREPFDYVQYARDYRRVHADEINRKQAINYEQNKGKILCKQILGRLNKSQTSKPMAKTIEIYQLYQPKPGGPWFSNMFDGE